MVTAQQWALVAAVVLAGALRSGQLEAAPAERPDHHAGLSVGARLGMGLPLGDRTNVGGTNEPMGPKANFGSMVPLWIDAGYRLTEHLYLGAYFQYGLLLVAKEHGCPQPLTGCTAYDLRGGLGAHYHFMPREAVDLWVGLGFGYEASTTSYEAEGRGTRRTNGGPELANVQVGVDMHPIFGLDWGPFASVSIGEYVTESRTPPFGPSETYALPDKTFHYFVVFGMRVQCDF